MEALHVVLSSLLSFIALFILAKFLGKRQMSELSLFDYINGITIGSIAAEMVTAPLGEVYKGLIGMAIYTGLVISFSWVSDKSMRVRRLVEGESLLLFDAGRFFRENLRKAKLDLNEFLMQCRESGFFDLNELEVAMMEPNGRISFLPRAQYRPYTPNDAGLAPGPVRPALNVLADGRVLSDNLSAAGHDMEWLEDQLRSAGVGSPSDVMLGYIDASGKLAVFRDANGQPGEGISG